MDQFILLELREAKIQEFINLCQRSMSVREYAQKFIKLSRHIPFMVTDPRARMSKFISGISSLVFKEYEITMLVKEMDIFRLMTYLDK